jgi:zinc protease
VFQRDSMYAQAMDIGSLITAGLPAQFTDEQVRRLQDVTAEQVQAAALKFFSDQGLTVAVLHPLPVGTKSTPRVPESAQPGTEPQ